MTRAFVDTSAWIAAQVSADGGHRRAVTAMQGLQKRYAQLVTSWYVVDETITYLRARHTHADAVRFGAAMFATKMIILEVSAPERTLAWDLFQKYSDHRFSFTDCTSFVLMRKHGIREAVSLDDDFRTLGEFSVIPNPAR